MRKKVMGLLLDLACARNAASLLNDESRDPQMPRQERRRYLANALRKVCEDRTELTEDQSIQQG